MKIEDYQAVVNFTCMELGIKTIPVRVKEVQAGHANIHYITLPKWLESYCIEYQLYYAVHEAIHYLPGCRNHKAKFKENEDNLLSWWGLSIIRKKAYLKKLYSNGLEMWDIPNF